MRDHKDIKRAKAKGRWYYYYRTGNRDANGKEVLARLPDPSESNFGDTLAAYRAAKTRRKNASHELTVAGLIDLYERGQHFKDVLSAGTRRIYRIYLDQLKDMMGEAPAGLIEQVDVARMIDLKADTPGAANSLLRVTNALWKWGRKRGHVKNDPGTDLETMDVGEHEPWPEHVLETVLGCDAEDVRLAVHLLYFTALRFNDALGLRWSDLRDGAIHVTPQKTRRTRGEMRIDLHDRLREELARTPRRGLTILADANGKPLMPDSLRKRIQREAAKHGVKVVPHGLRKNAVNALLEAGCSVAETAAISGQSLQMIEHYAKRRSQPRLGSAAILRWQNKGGK
jgi:integrase